MFYVYSYLAVNEDFLFTMVDVDFHCKIRRRNCFVMAVRDYIIYLFY